MYRGGYQSMQNMHLYDHPQSDEHAVIAKLFRNVRAREAVDLMGKKHSLRTNSLLMKLSCRPRNV